MGFIKDKIIYLVGKKRPAFRKWYHKKNNEKSLWGIVNFMDDFSFTAEEKYDWGRKLKYDEWNKWVDEGLRYGTKRNK